MPYGLQLFGVRDAAQEDFEGMLCQVAQMGYHGVEFASFFDRSPEDVAAMLRHYGLTVYGAHVQPDVLFSQLKETIRFHQILGNTNIVLPWVYYETREELFQSIQSINHAIPVLRDAGIFLHFHNHWEELCPNRDGLITVEELVKNTDVLLELDTFWAYDAGRDPVAMMEQYRERIRMIHLKDGFSRVAVADGDSAKGTSLGLGAAPVRAVRKKAMELGFFQIVESEGLDPTGIEESKRCIEYLKAIDAEKGD